MWQCAQSFQESKDVYRDHYDPQLGQKLLQERVHKVQERVLRRNAVLDGPSAGQQMIKEMIKRRKKIANRQRIAKCIPAHRVENLLTCVLVVVGVFTIALLITCGIWSAYINNLKVLSQDAYARPVTLLVFVSWIAAICVYVSLVQLHDTMIEFAVDPDDSTT
jgi:hypothetical protein